ncbi:MAG: elongation factor G [Polyangiales bacterium]
MTRSLVSRSDARVAPRTPVRSALPEIERIRNFGVVAHVDAGKTTLSERILVLTGRLRRAGEVHHGNTALDHQKAEQEKGITITAATVRCLWDDHALHLVDTPGHVDFGVEVVRSLRVLDGAVVVLDGVAGVEPQTETVWRVADTRDLPRVVFVNKLDRAGASFERTVREIERTFGVVALPLVVPVELQGASEELVLLDVVAGQLLRWTDDEGRVLVREALPSSPSSALRAFADASREALVETVANHDDAFAELWLAGSASTEALVAAIRRGTIARRAVPVLGGSAFQNRGVQPLLDAVVSYLPSPLDRGEVVGVSSEETTADDAELPRRAPSDDAPLAALAFKVVHDRHGALVFVRVYSGVLREGETVRRARDGKTFRVGRLVRLFADRREPLSAVHAGEIAGLLGADLVTGDTLADPNHPIALESVHPPEPVMELSVEPERSKDRDRLGEALRRLLVEDPSVRVRVDEETGQTLLAGLGELHLEIATRRLREDHGVEVRLGRPKVAYRETLPSVIEHAAKLQKQSGGPGQYAHVVVRVGPAEPGEGLVFSDRTVGGSVPKAFVPSIEKGLHDAMTRGPLGFPVVDVAVELLDGSFHPNDSHDRDFQIVASMALREAMKRAGPAVLEPWAKLTIETPEDHVGAVLGELALRRGRVESLDTRAGRVRIVATTRVAALFGFAGQLAGLTSGRGHVSTEPCGYERVPDAQVAEALR